MRILQIAVVSAVLGGCSMPSFDLSLPKLDTSTPVAARPNEQFVGQKVESLAARFGPPSRSKRMDDGQAFYLWQLNDATDAVGDHGVYSGAGGLYGDGRTPGYISFDPRFCKLSVMASPEGIITQFIAEDLNGTGAPDKSIGVSRSICAERLGTKSRT